MQTTMYVSVCVCVYQTKRRTPRLQASTARLYPVVDAWVKTSGAR